MRMRRIRREGVDAIYHCMTRVVNGEFLIEKDYQKEILRKSLWKCAEFSGVELLTYCIMSNHFHVLVRVRHVEHLSDQELMRRYELLYPKPTKYQAASIEVMRAELKKNGEEAVKLREKLLARMHDVSQFMKLVKQRYSVWYNKTHNRYGTLWADRFKSVLVEGAGNPLQTMAAYIDLNPVRANIVTDPKDYRFSGYGEAVGGNHQKAKEGLRTVMDFSVVMRETDLRKQLKDATIKVSSLRMGKGENYLTRYRTYLYAKGSKALGSEQYLKELDRNGVLDRSEILRVRVRYFTDGVVLGSKEYVDTFFENHRMDFGKKRKQGARKMKGSDWGGLHVIRDLRREVFG